MSANPQDEKDKVVELAKARRQMETLRSQRDLKKASLRGPSNGGKPVSARQGRPRRTFWEYVQLVIFMAMAAYVMHLCSGGGI